MKTRKLFFACIILLLFSCKTTQIPPLPADKVRAGKELFRNYCTPCHGRNGEGGVGPNHTDDAWLHGASRFEIVNSIRYGVPEKGMIAWKDQITYDQIDALSYYILSLEGSNPVNAKGPQGKHYSKSELQRLRSKSE